MSHIVEYYTKSHSLYDNSIYFSANYKFWYLLKLFNIPMNLSKYTNYLILLFISNIELKIAEKKDKASSLKADIIETNSETEENIFNEVANLIITVFEREWVYRKKHDCVKSEKIEKDKHLNFMNFYLYHLVSKTIRSNRNELIAKFRDLVGEEDFLDNEIRYIQNLSFDVDFDDENIECEADENRVSKIMKEKTLYPVFFKYTFHLIIKDIL